MCAQNVSMSGPPCAHRVVGFVTRPNLVTLTLTPEVCARTHQACDMVEAAQRRTGADLPRVKGADVMGITRSVQPVPREPFLPFPSGYSYHTQGGARTARESASSTAAAESGSENRQSCRVGTG